MKFYFVLIILISYQIHSETLEDNDNFYELKTAKGKEALYFAGFYSSIVIHELGHAITPLLFFGYPTAFKIWPHRRGNQIQVGYVTWYGPGLFFPAVNPFIQFMGVGINMLTAYFGAELIPKSTNIYSREYLKGVLYSCAIYYPLYMITDVIFGNKYSDFDLLKKQTGIGKFWFFLVGLGSSYLLVNRLQKYEKFKPNIGVVSQVTPKSNQFQTHDLPLYLSYSF